MQRFSAGPSVWCPGLLWLGLLWMAFVIPAAADDIDLYQPALRSHYLNVLIDPGDADVDHVLCTLGVDCPRDFMSAAAYSNLQERLPPGADVSGSDVFLAVLDSALAHPALADMNIALGISNHHGNSDTQGRRVGGGTLLQGYRKPAQSRRALGNILTGIPPLRGMAAHAFQPRESFLEWLRYIRGESVALGTNTAGNYGAAQAFPAFDRTIIQDGKYLQGVNPAAICPNVVSLIFSSGPPLYDTDLDEEIGREVGVNAGGAFENFIRALFSESYNLLPKRVSPVSLGEVWIVGAGEGHQTAQFLAHAAGTAPLSANDPQALEKALTERLLRLLLPQPITTQFVFGPRIDTAGGVQRDVFLAQAEVASGAAWRGNLKKLRWNRKFARGKSNARNLSIPAIADAFGEPALDVMGSEGTNLRFDALSYWTNPEALTVGDGVRIPVGVDGPVVARGGAGQHVDGSGGSSRRVFVESPGQVGLTAFHPTASLAAELDSWLNPDGALSAGEVVDLIRWGSGQDTAAGQTSSRDWLMGEVLHSTPVVLNYGPILGHTPQNPKVRIFFGSGDGLLRGVENTEPNGEGSGKEVFAFYPLESLPNLRLLRDNRLSMSQKVYGVDGPSQLLRHDVNGDGKLIAAEGDRALIFFGMRRGGSSYYALDVSDPEAPPRLVWKIDPKVNTHFKNIALSFSPPVVIKLEVGGNILDALAFGGGYNGGWKPGFAGRLGKDMAPDDDADNVAVDAGDEKFGNALYIVEALTGKLIWKAVHGETGQKSARHYEHAALVDGIAAPVVPLVDARGLTTRLYVGDTGGSVWRVDLLGTKGEIDRSNPERWFITKFADLNPQRGEEVATKGGDRRFFHAVDVVHATDSTGSFDGVLIASGDRAHPDEMAEQNDLFYLKDRQIEDGSLAVRSENQATRPVGRIRFADLPLAGGCLDGEGRGSRENTLCGEPSSIVGWRLPLSSPGEKGFAAPVVDGGRIFLTTYTPGDSAECSGDIGRGRLYEISLTSAEPVSGNAGYSDLGPGIPQQVQLVDDVLFVPGWPVERSVADSPKETTVSRFVPSGASQLIDLYWIEVGVDAW